MLGMGPGATHPVRISGSRDDNQNQPGREQDNGQHDDCGSVDPGPRGDGKRNRHRYGVPGWREVPHLASRPIRAVWSRRTARVVGGGHDPLKADAQLQISEAHVAGDGLERTGIDSPTL